MGQRAGSMFIANDVVPETFMQGLLDGPETVALERAEDVWNAEGHDWRNGAWWGMLGE